MLSMPLGLGYDVLRELNRGLVQVSISGWGTRGPLAREQGYAVLAGAYSGAVRPPQGPDEMPELRGASADPATALLATIGALAALLQKVRSGEGGLVTTSVFQGAMHLGASFLVVADNDRTPNARATGMSGSLGGMSPFRTSDGRWVYISAWADKQFERLCRLAQLEHVAASGDYTSRQQRTAHGNELNELIGHWVASQPHDELLKVLRSEKIPAAPMRMSVEELFDDPQVRANDMFVPVEHATKGTLWQLRNMVEINGQFGHQVAAPLLGEHTDQILSDFGYAPGEIAELRELGAVG